MAKVPDVLCAPNAWKETVSASAAASALAGGVADAGGRGASCPIADGGEGTLDALIGAWGGRTQVIEVVGPRETPVRARWGLCQRDGERIGVVEMAEASGMRLLERSRRDPTRTTSYGTGQLVMAAVEAGCGRVIIGLGGSGTVDGGVGLLQALGHRFLDDAGKVLPSPLPGGRLADIRGRHPPEGAWPAMDVACDVRNPLLGVEGAAAVFGPQKGATAEQVARLEAGLASLAALATDADLALHPGAGAAGGVGFGLAAFAGATLLDGAALILDAVGFEDRCRGADLVLTGEGRLDEQSGAGKATLAAAAVAAREATPIVAIVGQCSLEARARFEGTCFARIESLAEGSGLESAMADPERLMSKAARLVVERWMNDWSAGPFGDP